MAAIASPARGSSPAAAGTRPGWRRIARCSRQDGTPRLDAEGMPVDRTLIFPKTSATMNDVWHVIGLKGTGSDSYSVADLFVPARPQHDRVRPQSRREARARSALSVHRVPAVRRELCQHRHRHRAHGTGRLRRSRQEQDAVRFENPPARQRGDPVADRPGAEPARVGAGVPASRPGGNLERRAGRRDHGRAAHPVAHGLHPRDASGQAGRRRRLSCRRRDRDLREQSRSSAGSATSIRCRSRCRRISRCSRRSANTTWDCRCIPG